MVLNGNVKFGFRLGIEQLPNADLRYLTRLHYNTDQSIEQHTRQKTRRGSLERPEICEC